MSGVKRYDVLGDCDGGYLDEAKEGRAVLYTDYAVLEAELATVKKVSYGNLELMEDRDAALAECEKLAQCLKFARTTMAVVADNANLRGVEYRSLISEIKRIDAALSAKP